MPVGGEIVSAWTSASEDGISGSYITAGKSSIGVDHFFTNRADAIDADVDFTVWLKVSNPAGEGAVILAGMVEPTSLASVVYSLSDDSASSIVCPFDQGTGDTSVITNSAGTITVPAGKYRIIAHATRHADVLDYELWNVTDSVSIQQYNIDSSTIDGSGVTLPIYVTFTSTKQLQIRETDGDVAIVWNGSDGGGTLGYGPYGS